MVIVSWALGLQIVLEKTTFSDLGATLINLPPVTSWDKGAASTRLFTAKVVPFYPRQFLWAKIVRPINLINLDMGWKQKNNDLILMGEKDETCPWPVSKMDPMDMATWPRSA